MKRLFLTARLNPKYVGPDHTPDLDKHVYDVAKVIDSTVPAVGDVLTREAVDAFCNSELWTVTIT